MFQNVPEGKNWLKNYVISQAWYSSYTKQKFQTLFKSCSSISEGKIRLKIQVIYLDCGNFQTKEKFQSFFSSCSKILRKQKWAWKLSNIPRLM